MGRIFGILIIVIGVWVGAEVYTEGVHGAFGGRLAFLAEGQDGPGDTRTPGARVGDSVGGAHAEAEARRARLLAE